MKFGFWLNTNGSKDLVEAVEWGVLAEEAGWDGVFVADSIFGGLV